MDHSGYSAHWDNKPHSDYHPYDEEDYNHYSSKHTHSKRHVRPDTEYNLHTFKKTQPNRHKREFRNLPPKYFEIQPYLDNILSDEITGNKEVQRTLKDLRSLNEQILSELHQGGTNQRQDPPLRGNDWDAIQRLIMQIINNSQNETSEFKASLQHLKNLKDRTLQEDLDYEEEGDYSEYDRPDKYDRRPPRYQRNNARAPPQDVRGGRPFSQTFEPRTQNQRRLMEEIMDLREQNSHIRRRLNEEVDKNRYLSDRIYDFEEQSHSGVRQARVDRSYEEQLQRLNQRVKESENQNHHLRQQLRDRERAGRSVEARGNSRYLLESLNRLKKEGDELRKDTVQLLETKGQGRSYENRANHDWHQGESRRQNYRNQTSYY